MSVTTATRSEVTFFPSRRSVERLEEKGFVVLDVEEATGRPRVVATLHVAPQSRNGLFVSNDPINYVDPDGLQSALSPGALGTLPEIAAIEAGYPSAAAMARALAAAALAASLPEEAQGLYDHMQGHINKVNTVCPSGSPDPNDPNQDPVKKWIKEVKAAVKNLEKVLKKLPNNKSKREPVEKAIKEGNDALNQWGQ